MALTYDLLEDKRIDDVIIKTFFSVYFNSLLYKTNRFQVAVRLFSNRSQRTSKCGNGNLETICELDYSELLRKCSEIEINISDREIEIVEQDTRTQAKGPGFLRYRYRNCGLLNVTPHYPILTFIKGLEFNNSSNK